MTAPMNVSLPKLDMTNLLPIRAILVPRNTKELSF